MGVIVLNDVPCNFSVEVRIWLSDGSLALSSLVADLRPMGLSRADLDAMTLRAARAGYKPLSHLTRRIHAMEGGS